MRHVELVQHIADRTLAHGPDVVHGVQEALLVLCRVMSMWLYGQSPYLLRDPAVKRDRVTI